MKLSHLYCNLPDIFAPIRFHQGLNAVVARIDHPKDAKKLGHNLGKTLLTEVIDFTLLKGVDKHHTFKRHSELFDDFVFFIELELPSGGYLTIRRAVDEPSKIAFKRHPERHENFSELEEPAWDHWRESFDNAVDLLDSILAFERIHIWPVFWDSTTSF